LAWSAWKLVQERWIIPWLDLVDSLDKIIRGEAINVDRDNVKQKVDKVVDIGIGFILLHSRE
jgi:hypothetical protein